MFSVLSNVEFFGADENSTVLRLVRKRDGVKGLKRVEVKPIRDGVELCKLVLSKVVVMSKIGSACLDS